MKTVAIFGIVFVTVSIVIIVWISNLYQDIEYYKSEIDNYFKTNKTFIIVEYKYKGKEIKSLTKEIKISPKMSYEVKIEDNYTLVGVCITRMN